MPDLLFANATIFDATGTAPYLGEVLIRGTVSRPLRRCLTK